MCVKNIFFNMYIQIHADNICSGIIYNTLYNSECFSYICTPQIHIYDTTYSYKYILYIIQKKRKTSFSYHLKYQTYKGLDIWFLYFLLWLLLFVLRWGKSYLYTNIRSVSFSNRFLFFSIVLFHVILY